MVGVDLLSPRPLSSLHPQQQHILIAIPFLILLLQTPSIDSSAADQPAFGKLEMGWNGHWVVWLGLG